MDDVTLVIAEDEIEKQSVRCRELDEQRRALLDRIQRADSVRESVREPIYRRVRAEYEARLSAIEGEFQPLASALEKSRASIEDQIGQIDLRDEELRDELDELVFRHRVGEFDGPAFDEARAPFEEERESLARKRRELSEILSRIGVHGAATPYHEAAKSQAQPADTGTDPVRATRDPRPTPPTGAPSSTTEPPRSTVGSPSSTTEPPRNTTAADLASPEVETEGADAFVDPSEWLGEFLPDESLERPLCDGGRRAEASGAPKEERRGHEEKRERGRMHEEDPGNIRPPQTDATDTLSDLADPGSESAGPIDDVAECDAGHFPDGASGIGLPILTIASGPGAGKKLPLLPVTMTLGREVDNNIELKDKDVARYHARIAYESGKYVIQDIEGSSGTFVNGQRVTKVALAAGDVIRVGSTELSLDLA